MARPPLKVNLGFDDKPTAAEAMALATAMTEVVPTMERHQPPATRSNAAIRSREVRKVTMDFPTDIDLILAQKALTESTSKTVLVLKALKSAGYPVADEYLVDARRTAGRK
jgi:hypothetical protein